MDVISIETVEELKSKQSILPDWMQKATAGFITVEVTRRHTPFGTFVIGIVGVN